MRKRLFGFAMAAALLASACGSSATPAPTTAPSTAPGASSSAAASAAASTAALPDLTKTSYKPTAVGNRGGKLLVGLSGEPSTIWYNVYDTFANDVDAFGPALWGLWNNTSDLKYYGQLASNVPTTGNGGVKVNGTKMDVTINLIPGEQWSDGQAITCDDLAYEVTWFMDKDQSGNTQGTAGWEDVSSVDGGSGTTCVAHFSKIYENYLSLWSPLLPAHYLKTSTVKDAVNNLYKQTDPASGVYSGPYIPTAWASGAQIDFKANPKFWDSIKKAQAPFDGWTLKLYANNAAMIAGFNKGEVDAALEMNHVDLAAIKSAQIPDANVSAVDSVTYEQHSWNMADLIKKFGTAGANALMEAVKYAYDKNAINARILGGSATPSCSFTSAQAWFYSDVPCYKTDTAKASDILSKAGFTKGSDGTLVAPNGTKVELAGCTRSDRQYRVDTMVLMASQLAAIGIKVTNQAVNPSILFKGWSLADSDVPCNLTHGNFDVAEFAWVSTPDPTSIYQLYDSKFDPSQGDHSGQNYIRINNPTVDQILETNNTTVDLQVIKDNMAKLQQLYVDPANHFPEVALYNWRTVNLVGSKLHNFSGNGSASVQTWNLEDWWKG